MYPSILWTVAELYSGFQTFSRPIPLPIRDLDEILKSQRRQDGQHPQVSLIFAISTGDLNLILPRTRRTCTFVTGPLMVWPWSEIDVLLDCKGKTCKKHTSVLSICWFTCPQLFVRVVLTRSHNTRRARIRCMPRESVAMIVSSQVMVGRLNPSFTRR